jgi:phosphate transport system substrate-binding protein
MPQALISGASPLGIETRRMTRSEMEDFRFHWGYLPTEVLVGGDAVSIVVHPENPLRGLSLEEIDSIFSSNCRRGGKPVQTWGEVGLEGDWKGRPIHAFGVAKDSAPRTMFQETALQGGLFQKDLRELAGVDAVLGVVAEDPCAIGYVGGWGGFDRCRVVALRATSAGSAVEPQPETILSMSYPLAWRIYIAVRRESRAALDPVANEFLKMILSRDGQEVLAGEGLVPVTGKMARRELLKLN